MEASSTEPTDRSETETETETRPRPTAFTIDLDFGRPIDASRYESLVRKSLARQRRRERARSSAETEPEPEPEPEPESEPEPRPRPSSATATAGSRPPRRVRPSERSSLRLPLAVSYEAPLIADTSSPELEPATPATPVRRDGSEPEPERSRSASPDAVSEAGTYTIDADLHTEEQKAKMSIDEAFGLSDFDAPLSRALRVREELRLAGALPEPQRNVLEVSYRYESPTGSSGTPAEEPAPRPSPRPEPVDAGSFTSVTASGVLGARSRTIPRRPVARSENLVLQRVTADSFTPEDAPDRDREERAIVEGLSGLSLDRCRGDVGWIREWADGVQRFNREAGLPPLGPRRNGATSPAETPSPVVAPPHRRPPVPDILTSTPDTESYLQNTQNLISNLQAKLQNAKSTPLSKSELFQNAFQDRFASSKLPVSRLNRSNSLNYRLYRKNNSAENSPLRNPGNYLVTGTLGLPSSARLLLSNIGASKSLDTDPNISPISDITRNGTHSRHHSFDARNYDRPEDDFHNANMTQSLNLKFTDIESKSNPRRIAANERLSIDQTIRNVPSPGDRKRLPMKAEHHRGLSDSNVIQNSSRRVAKFGPQSQIKESPIRRSSSFNIVNKNNNIYDSNVKHLVGSPVPRISSNHGYRRQHDGLMRTSCDFPLRNNTPEIDCMSEDSDNLSTGGFYSDYDRRHVRKSSNEFFAGARCNRAFALRRARLESPDARAQQAGSPLCPATPEMRRKNSIDSKRPARSHSRDSRSVAVVGRVTDARPDVCQVSIVENNKTQKPKKNAESTKQSIANRLTRSITSAKEFVSKSADKSSKKAKSANQAVSSSSKEVELSNWKKRSSYDPMKAALEGKKNKLAGKMNPSAAIKIEDVGSPSNSSPVHRSRSFNCTNTPVDERISVLQQIQGEGGSDASDFEDRLICTLPAEGSNNVPILKMISAADVSPKMLNTPDVTKRIWPAQNHKIKLSTDYITKLQIDQSGDRKKSSFPDRRKTYIVDGDNKLHESDCFIENDRRRTVILDSDTTNSTTNGSNSRRNSSVYSDDRVNNEQLSDSDAESDTEPITNVVHRVKSKSVPPQQRHSGDFSMSSSTCSATKDVSASKKSTIQPRYLDISRYKNNETAAKNFLRKDPSKTYVSVLPSAEHRQSRKNTAKQLEQEQKNRELEKWKRRASYDPRKSAAQAKLKPNANTATTMKSPSNSVLRSQSFHGPMLQPTKLSLITSEKKYPDVFYQDISSDNEF